MPPLLPAFEFVAELLIFVEGTQPCSLNGRDVDEYVLRAVIGLNKSISLLGVEPLYCSPSHRTFLQSKTTAIQHRWRVRSRHGTEAGAGPLCGAGEGTR